MRSERSNHYNYTVLSLASLASPLTHMCILSLYRSLSLFPHLFVPIAFVNVSKVLWKISARKARGRFPITLWGQMHVTLLSQQRLCARTPTEKKKDTYMPITFIQRCLLHFYQSQLLANSTSARFPDNTGASVIMSDSCNMAAPSIPHIKIHHQSHAEHHQPHHKYSKSSILIWLIHEKKLIFYSLCNLINHFLC